MLLIAYEMLGNRRDELYQLYTNIPEQIPERVVELARRLPPHTVQT